MPRSLPARLLLLSSTLLVSLQSADAPAWQPLLDAQLSHWEVWMGVPHSSVIGLPPGTTQSDNVTKGTPLGLNHDPKKVFSVIEQDGVPVLKITGEIYGGLTTLASYGDYHFSCQVRWGEKKWPPRENLRRDSGLLYHCTGPHGAFWNVWKRCVEFQVQEKDFGDLFMLAGTGGDVRYRDLEVKAQYDPKGIWDQTRPLRPLGRVQRSADHESPHGEWSTLEVYTVGNRALHLVNGHVVMAIENIREKSRSGSEDFVSLASGQIQIQSEGAEVYYRDIKLRPLTQFPENLARAAGFTP
ncbi:MAG: hypothetical protein QG602_248 [Verrucomicrobiota bacterium]|nr:hypothetical protein [Verrucomicrobiota bacterium]